MSPEKFLNLIHGPDAAVYFNVASITWKNKPQSFRQAESKLRWRNGQGDDICYIVNSGGTKDQQITGINAVFVDWDVGRDEHERYYPEEVVRIKKAKFLRSLRIFSFKPSIMVETRNGFHVYWLVEAGVTASQFRECQVRLAARFDGDPQVQNPARVMRLPGFDWVKPSSGCPRFAVRVVSGRPVRHRIEDLLTALPTIATVAKKPTEGRICAHNKCKCNTSRNTSLALIVGPKPPQMAVVLRSMAEALEYLKQQDIALYLKIPATPCGNGYSLHCPFHDDTNPSAGVYQASGSGHWLFKCHVCNFAGTIIDVATKQLQGDEAAALCHLLDHFQIEIDTGWKDEQRQRLTQNKKILSQLQAFQGQYPCLYKLIWRIRADLISKLTLAQEYIGSERNQHHGQLVFYASLRHFHMVAGGRDELPRYLNRQNEKVDRYCLLGLMRKLADGEVPPTLLKQAQDEQKARKQPYRIQFYSIPAYTEEVLTEANKRACKLVAAGASVRGISWELIESLFGADVAAGVYPQVEASAAGRSTVGFCAQVEGVVMEAIRTKGYTTAAEVCRVLGKDGGWKTVNQRRLEKCLPGVLIRNGLTRCFCDSDMKRRLGIMARGYPRVIIARSPSAHPNSTA